MFGSKSPSIRKLASTPLLMSNFAAEINSKIPLSARSRAVKQIVGVPFSLKYLKFSKSTPEPLSILFF